MRNCRQPFGIMALAITYNNHMASVAKRTETCQLGIFILLILSYFQYRNAYRTHGSCRHIASTSCQPETSRIAGCRSLQSHCTIATDQNTDAKDSSDCFRRDVRTVHPHAMTAQKTIIRNRYAAQNSGNKTVCESGNRRFGKRTLETAGSMGTAAAS